jgi:predicted porin
MDDWNDGSGWLAGGAGVAQAQSSVQVYGLLSAGIGYVSDEGKAAARMR